MNIVLWQLNINFFYFNIFLKNLIQNTVEEIVTTTAYLELFLRTITEPILLQMFLKFILTASYDGHRILNSLVDRLGAQSRVSFSVFTLNFLDLTLYKI